MAWQDWGIRGTLRHGHGAMTEVFAVARDDEAGLLRSFPLRFEAEVPEGMRAEHMPVYEALLSKFEPQAADA
jgi:hypothetical protein